MKVILFITLFLVHCTHQPPKPTASQKPEWILKSDKIAEEFTKNLANIHPEIGSEIGFKEFDKLGLLLDNSIDERYRSLLQIWVKKMESEKNNTSDIELKTDIEVMQNWLRNQIEEQDTGRTEGEVSFSPGLQVVYQNLNSIANPQASKDRKSAAVDRFKVYVNGDPTHRPLLQAMQENFEYKFKMYQPQKKRLLPFKDSVEQYLKDSDSFLSGIEDLLKSSGRMDWTADWMLFKIQAAQYNKFSKEVALKYSRQDPRVPLSIYTQILKQRGIESTPEQLIQTGLSDYTKIYKQFAEQAKLVAQKHGLKSSTPASVIKHLKSKPITQIKDVELLYKAADQRLDKIMKDNNLISVPKTPLVIRIAGEAESRNSPVPHMKPPPLIDNQGERPEFVVPSSEQGLPFDDFSSAHSAIILTAHEGRPGHDMQFSQMLDNGLSVIRSRYAANNVNIEGWALYAEDLVFPYLEPEEKLFAYQTRLWRVARMFLDPQIQLGKIKDQRVVDVFTKELGVSSIMASHELRRYKYSDIAQAPSYYEGYLLVKKMRDDVQKQLGDKFNLRCFNDRLLSFGLLPLKISARRMIKELDCRN